MKTDQDILDLIPTNAVKTTEPKVWGDLNVGDYLFVKYQTSSALLLVYKKLLSESNLFTSGITAIWVKAIALTNDNEWEVGDTQSYPATSNIGSRTTVYRPSVGDSSGISKGTMIIGGLALATAVGSAIYFSTRR